MTFENQKSFKFFGLQLYSPRILSPFQILWLESVEADWWWMKRYKLRLYNLFRSI